MFFVTSSYIDVILHVPMFISVILSLLIFSSQGLFILTTMWSPSFPLLPDLRVWGPWVRFWFSFTLVKVVELKEVLWIFTPVVSRCHLQLHVVNQYNQHTNIEKMNTSSLICIILSIVFRFVIPASAPLPSVVFPVPYKLFHFFCSFSSACTHLLYPFSVAFPFFSFLPSSIRLFLLFSKYSYQVSCL